ncbi:type III secretion protein U [Erwinia toletana]|uniref:Type III secretion protein U n=1 Tax=Winslowiella toletana TaxID=92490 RepID=A0ABS4P9M1_9GAMM|nr:EscU/YscU/HrcU family type III secretion system export apparatus switch protein [Winslowiella toletana]MBP2168820.1 type III secretion protein U [Winslowiella toletana]
MSTSKTEKPTDKKKRDAAKKGQTFKGKDLIITCLTLVGIEVVLNFTSLRAFSDLLQMVVERQYHFTMHGYILQCVWFGLKILLPVLALCIAASFLPGILQTGMRLATKILKLNFAALNPIKGFKKIFNLRNLKDLIKVLLYLACFVFATLVFWQENRALIISLVYAEPDRLFKVWGQLMHSLLVIFIASIFTIILIDCVAEYLLYIKELKMDKKEVDRESKEINGNPEIKKKRKSLHQELLSEETKNDIKKSNAIIANPKHIAVGIYLNAEIAPIPFISVLEKNQRALAVRRYAEKVGVPVVENVQLAREIYHTHQKYTFISVEKFSEVMEILVWLRQVERKWQTDNSVSNEKSPAPEQPSGSHADGDERSL